MDADELESLTAAAYERADASGGDALRQAAAAFTPGSGAARDEAVLGGAWLVTYKLGQRAADLLAALAALLRAALSPAAPDIETGPPGWTVSVWCTPVGGGAVVTDPDGCPALAVLPGFTLDRAQEWTRRLASAARLSSQVMDAVLQQVLPGLSRLVTEPVTRLVPRDAPLTWCAGGVAAMLPVAAADAADRTPLMLRHLLRQAPTPSIATITAAAARRRTAPTGGSAWTIAAPSLHDSRRFRPRASRWPRSRTLGTG